MVNVSFKNNVYAVNEADKIVGICVCLTGELEREVTIQLTTIEGTAMNGSDYIEVVKEERVFQPTSQTDNLEECWDIVLVDDNILEENETFSVTLTINDTSVDFNGSTAEVVITDNDCKLRNVYRHVYM